MSDKKKIKECEWPMLDRFAEDANTSLAKVYDVLREGRISRHEDLMNRSWFMNFMRAVCNCVDGKMKGYRRPKNKPEAKGTPVVSENVVEPKVEETSVAVENVVEPKVEETSVAESMSELLKKNTILIMKWMFERKAQNFHSMTAEGFSKAKIEKAVKELISLGILKKKNPRRFEPLDWDSLVKDFPEISVPITEQEKNSLLTVPKATLEVKQPLTPVAKTEKPKQKKLTDMEKMVEWLLEDEHPQGEITKGEVVNELRRMKSVKDPYTEATILLVHWEQNSAIAQVPGTFAYRILPTASLLKFTTTPETSSTRMTSESQEKQDVVKNPDVKTGRDLILRSNGKDVRVVNKSDANLTVTIENGDIVLTIA